MPCFAAARCCCKPQLQIPCVPAAARCDQRARGVACLMFTTHAHAGRASTQVAARTPTVAGQGGPAPAGSPLTPPPLPGRLDRQRAFESPPCRENALGTSHWGGAPKRGDRSLAARGASQTGRRRSAVFPHSRPCFLLPAAAHAPQGWGGLAVTHPICCCTCKHASHGQG